MGAFININGKTIGDGFPCYIIAEMSANHGGDFNRALEIIRVAKKCGADCVKVQVYKADTMTIDCDKDYFQIKEGTWKNENLFKLYQKAYTPWEWLNDLKNEATKIGIDFLATPFDKTSVEYLERIGIDFYKIASQELTDIPLISYVAKKGKPMIISTGMGTLEEINEALEVVETLNNESVCILKCSSTYPASLENMNLKTIQDMKERFKIPVGLSDHSMGFVSAVAAIALGANIIEKHFCLSRKHESVDSSFSMEPLEFENMIKQIRDTEKAIGKVNYDLTEEEQYSRNFRRSIFAIRNIKKGEEITESNIKVIRPAYGLPPKKFEYLLGKIVTKDIERGTPISWSMIDDKLKI